MSIAKGKVFITKEKLSELFGLPEGVEVLSIKELDLEHGYELVVASAEETVVTKKNTPISFMRRVFVDELLKEKEKHKNEEVIEILLFGDDRSEVIHREVVPPIQAESHWFKANPNYTTTVNNFTNISNVNKPKSEEVKDIFDEIIASVNKNSVNRR